MVENIEDTIATYHLLTDGWLEVVFHDKAHMDLYIKWKSLTGSPAPIYPLTDRSFKVKVMDY